MDAHLHFLCPSYSPNFSSLHYLDQFGALTSILILLGTPIHYFAYPIWLICSGKQVYYRNFLQRDYAIMYQEKTFNFTGRGSRKKFATKLCLVLTFFMSRLMFWQGTFNIHHILPLFVFIYRPGWKLFALPPWVWKTIFWANAAQKYFDFESMKVFDIFFSNSSSSGSEKNV